MHICLNLVREARSRYPQRHARLKPSSDLTAHGAECLTIGFLNSEKIYFKKSEKFRLTRRKCSGKLCLGRCGSCEFEHRQMDDGWGSKDFVRWTRRPELIGRNQSPVGALESKTQELVAPSGCCLESGIGSRRSERVGSNEQGYNDQPIFAYLLFNPLVGNYNLVTITSTSRYEWPSECCR